MSDLTFLQRRAARLLVDSIIEMEAYNDVPDSRKDPVWGPIRRRGAEALRAAKEAGLTDDRT